MDENGNDGRQQAQDLERLDKILDVFKRMACGMTGIDDAEFLATELSVKNLLDQTRKTEHEQT